MIIWLNGTFGAGKTTTAHELAKLVPGSRLFDPETDAAQRIAQAGTQNPPSGRSTRLTAR